MKKKNKSKKKPLIIILCLILIVFISGYILYSKYFKNEEPKVKIIKKINNFGYNLEENKSKLYKTTFDELEDVLTSDEVNYEDYAKVISKLFIIDFYTLDNKVSKNDIGGVIFINPEIRDNFILQARSTLYKYVELKENRKNNDFPSVSSIDSVDVEKTSFKYLDKETDEA